MYSPHTHEPGNVVPLFFRPCLGLAPEAPAMGLRSPSDVSM